MIYYVCFFILTLMGWDMPSTRMLHYLSSKKKKIIVYTHTSIFDFFLMCFYKGVFPEIRDILFAVNEKYYNMAPKLLSYIGCIPATDRSSVTNGGFIKNMIESLKYKDEYSFGISPEGTLIKSRWKGGYYYISKGLNDYEAEKVQMSDNMVDTKEKVYILPFGLNYEKHCLYIGSFHDMDSYMDRESIEDILQKEMENMVPLYPDKSFTPSKYKTTPTVVNYPLVTTWIGGFTVMYYLFSYSMFMFFTSIIGFVIAFIYHYTDEKYLAIVDRNYTNGWIILYSLNLWYNCMIFPSVCILPVISFILYIKGYGRKDTQWRSDNYLLYHSLFHLVGALSVVYPIYNIK